MTLPLTGLGNLPISPGDFSLNFDENAPAKGGVSFQDLLLDTINQTNDQQHAAQQAIEESLAGGDVTQIEVFSAMKKADLSLRMMLQFRNKLLEAFNEIKELRM